MAQPEISVTLDLRDLLCPLPVFKLRKALLSLSKGDCLKAVISDPMAEIDVPHFCQESGFEILSLEKTPVAENRTEYHFTIVK